MARTRRHDRQLALEVEGLEGKLLLSGTTPTLPGSSPPAEKGPTGDGGDQIGAKGSGPNSGPAESGVIANLDATYTVSAKGNYTIKSPFDLRVKLDKSGVGFDVSAFIGGKVVKDFIATSTQDVKFTLITGDATSGQTKTVDTFLDGTETTTVTQLPPSLGGVTSKTHP